MVVYDLEWVAHGMLLVSCDAIVNLLQGAPHATAQAEALSAPVMNGALFGACNDRAFPLAVQWRIGARETGT